MAVLAKIPTSDIVVSDIKDTLNANGGTVTNDASTFFTSAANIHKWSKHKPVPRTELFVQDFDPYRDDYMEDWWKGNDGQCGMSWQVYYTIDDVKGKNWIYTLPDNTYPKRLGDFAGYCPYANPPIATRIDVDTVKVKWYIEGTTAENTYTIYMDIPSSNYDELTIYDFDKTSDDLKSWYLYAQVGPYSYTGTSVLAEDPHVDINVKELGEGIKPVTLCLVSSNGSAYIPIPSDENNKTEFNLNVEREVPYYINALGVSDTLSTTGDGFVSLENYPWGEGMEPTDSVYFKAEVIKNSVHATSLYAGNLWGISESWNPIYDEYDGSIIGHETISDSLSGKIYIIEDGVRKGVEEIPLSTMAVGESRIFYFYWGGYGLPVYEDPEWNIDAGLTIYLGGPNGAWVAGFGYYQTRYDVEH